MSDEYTVEEIKGIVQVRKTSTFKLRVKWEGHDDVTEEPLRNLREHKDCECLLQPMF